jgi:hypothetical protein
VAEAKQVEFYGETFTLAGEFSEFALMEFAEAAEGGTDESSMHSMAAMLRLVLDCLVPDDQARFRATARSNRAKAEKLMEVLKSAMEASTERPTGQAADSSDGPVPIEVKSDSEAVDRVVRAFPNRPEIQAGILEAQGLETG